MDVDQSCRVNATFPRLLVPQFTFLNSRFSSPSCRVNATFPCLLVPQFTFLVSSFLNSHFLSPCSSIHVLRLLVPQFLFLVSLFLDSISMGNKKPSKASTGKGQPTKPSTVITQFFKPKFLETSTTSSSALPDEVNDQSDPPTLGHENVKRVRCCFFNPGVLH